MISIGITTPELLLAHIVTQAVIVFLQCTEVIFFVGVVFGTVNNGNNLTVIMLLSLTGFAGMLFGMCLLMCEHLIETGFSCIWLLIKFCRHVGFDLLWVTHDGQFRIDWCILSDDCAVWLTLATWGNASAIARLCSTFAIYNSNHIGRFEAQTLSWINVVWRLIANSDQIVHSFSFLFKI